ncbi:PhoH family protein [Neomegalonema sp.]|uniref:PhoH family protein n=1 Tax=Neomegalonema sp. TaxID=2039713 RepID=UPI002614032D|nr:PhoH family protein [Neomegalonema sp.]MDD2868872.1 PhoH family protein [Neomegalonema sp.]
MTDETGFPSDAPSSPEGVVLEFPDNRVAAAVFGPFNLHLAEIERGLGVKIDQRGNRLGIRGPELEVAAALAALARLRERAQRGAPIEAGDVLGAIRFAREGDEVGEASGGSGGGRSSGRAEAVRTRKKLIEPRTPAQRAYLDLLGKKDLVFGMGPAGTGKTYLAVAAAVAAFLDRKVERVVFSRPAVEAGERLGFLPGDMKEKVDPYLRPLYDSLHDMLPPEQVARNLESGAFEVAPLAFMRGRTLANAYVVLDEAQNCTVMQMKMFLTRLGENARMAVTGDPSQVDLPGGVESGLAHAVRLLENVEGVGVARFTGDDVVRHPLVARIVKAYDAEGARRSEARQPGLKS